MWIESKGRVKRQRQRKVYSVMYVEVCKLGDMYMWWDKDVEYICE